MSVGDSLRGRPVPAVATAAFVLALLATAAYFAGLVPGVPKALPTFVDLVTLTGVLFVLAAVAWAMSLLGG